MRSDVQYMVKHIRLSDIASKNLEFQYQVFAIIHKLCRERGHIILLLTAFKRQYIQFEYIFVG